MSLSGISRLTDQFTAEITADLGVLMNSFYISTTNDETRSLSGKVLHIVLWAGSD